MPVEREPCGGTGATGRRIDLRRGPRGAGRAQGGLRTAGTVGITIDFTLTVLDLTDFKRDLSELTDRLGHAQDCL